MTDQQVPPFQIRVGMDGILAARTVAPVDWQGIAASSNHLLGRGRALIPGYRPRTATLTAGSSYSYAYWFNPSYRNIDRLWSVSFEGAAADVTAGSASAVEIGGFPSDTYVSPFETRTPTTILERRASHSSTAATSTLVIAPTGVNATVHHIGCIEVPRRMIETTSASDGTDPNQFAGGQPIQRVDMDNLLSTYGSVTTAGLRTFVNYAVPYAVGGSTSTSFAYSTTSATFSSIFADGIPVLARVRYVGDTTRTIGARVYCWCSAGGSGEIRTSYNGSAGSVATFSHTSPAWQTTPNFTIDAEDLDVADGRRGSAWKTLNIQFRATAGTVYVTSFAAYEVN